MKKFQRSPYARLATDADKQAWAWYFAPTILIGFVQVTESDVTHWAAVIRHRGIYTKHTLHRLCDGDQVDRPTPMVEVNCMTCVVRIERGPREFRLRR